MKHLIPGTEIPCTLIRSRRKSYAIRVLPGGEVELRVPERMTAGQIELALARHAEWIAVHREKQKNIRIPDFSDGTEVPFLGKRLILSEASGGKSAIREENVLYLPAEERKEALADFYKTEAKHFLPERLAFWAEKTGLHYEKVQISSAQKRWGSCSSRKTISLSYRLMMLPEDCIDYVLVHELCHLVQMNHSAAFYAAVAAVLPDYREREKRVREAFVL